MSSEDLIPQTFDEIDGDEPSGLVIRTIIDFRLLSKTGKPVAFEDLAISGPAVLSGTLVEPLPEPIRNKMATMVCSSPQDVPDDTELAKLLPLMQYLHYQQN